LDQLATLGPEPEQVEVKVFPALEVYPASQRTRCVSKVEPEIEAVSLFTIVKGGHATVLQFKALDQVDAPETEAVQVAMNV